jgi:hypothetical protein
VSASREHPADHDELLAELLVGERAPDDSEVVRRLRECERCRADWEGLRETVAGLERAASARDEALAGQAALEEAPGEERLRETLEGLASERPPAAPRPFSRKALLVGLAASVVAGWLVWRVVGREPAPRQPVVLGTGALELLAPKGRGADFSRFVWKYDGDAVAYELRVFELADGARGAQCFPEKRCRETSWSPPAELLAALPDAIEWEVTVLLDLETGETASLQAWR